MKNNLSPRSYGTKLMEPKNNQAKVESQITTRKFNVELYDRTGELEYLDEEEKTVSKIDQNANAKHMREEVTTLDQFKSIGNTKDVAKKYGVSMQTVHGLKLSLQAKKAREEADMILATQTASSVKENEQLHIQEEIPSQTAPLLDHIDDSAEENQEGNGYLIDCYTGELSDEPLDRVIADLEENWKKPDKDIEELWKSIKSGITTLHKMHLNRSEMEFQERLAGVIEEC